MIVVSGGMQKSGSTVLHVYAASLLAHQHGARGQEEFEHWVAGGPVGGSGAFPWDGWTNHLDHLTSLALAHGPFSLKTHAAYPSLREALQGRHHKMIYSYRDPRDVLLSALDHGARSRRNNEWPYADCVDVETTLPYVVAWCEAAVTWLDAPDVALFRYETLALDPEGQVTRLAEHLEIASPREAALAVIEKERLERALGKNQFNTGRGYRWRSEMCHEDLQRCENALGAYIVRMGYRRSDG